LVKELTKDIIFENNNKSKIVRAVQSWFTPTAELGKQLNIYRSVYDNRSLDETTAQKIVAEAAAQYDKLDKKRVFNEQTRLIRFVNKNVSKDVFSNFIANYKNLANIDQFFASDLPPDKKVVLEQKIIDYMTSDNESTPEVEKKYLNDKLVFDKIVENFNNKYGETLNENQKLLVYNYVSSVEDNNLELKLYLNEELGRVKNALREHGSKEALDEASREKISKVLNIVEGYKDKQVTEDLVSSILKIQQLVGELQENVNKD
jgi:hypothetical protein